MTCRKFYSSKIELAGTILVITVAGVNFETLPNLTKFDLVLCQNIPAGASTSEVVVTDGLTDLIAYNLSGNLLRADQIRCRRCYPMIYGNDKEHVSMRRLLCNTSFEVTAPVSFSAKSNSDKKGA